MSGDTDVVIVGAGVRSSDDPISRTGSGIRDPSYEWPEVDGRVEVWRGDVRLSMSVSAPFVWRCLRWLSRGSSFPHPAHLVEPDVQISRTSGSRDKDLHAIIRVLRRHRQLLEHHVELIGFPNLHVSLRHVLRLS